MSLKQQFVTALYRFGSYYELIKVKGWRTILYTITLAVCTVVILLASKVPGYILVGGFSGMADDRLPEFSIKDGTLEMENYTYEDGIYKVVVDTSVENADISQVGNSMFAIIAGSKECYIFNGTQSAKMKFSELGTDISKADIVNNLSRRDVQAGLISGIAIMLFILCILSAVYNIAVLTLLGNIMNMMIVRTPIRFSDMLKLASYARTLPLVFSLVILVVVGFGVSTVVFYAVGMFYIYKALKNIKLHQEMVESEIISGDSQ